MCSSKWDLKIKCYCPAFAREKEGVWKGLIVEGLSGVELVPFHLRLILASRIFKYS